MTGTGSRVRLAWGPIGAALAGAVLLLLIAPPRAAADVPIGVVAPPIAPVGAEIRVQVEPCRDVPAADVRVWFRPAALIDWSTDQARSYPVRDAPDGWYALAVPRLPGGPYQVLIACAGEPMGFTSNGPGPLFTVEPHVVAGQTVEAFFYEPCDGAGDAPVWSGTRVFASRFRDARSIDDARLIETAVVYAPAEASDGGFYAVLRVPRVRAGAYYLYSSCDGTFRLQDVVFEAPQFHVGAAPDTATEAPSEQPGPLGFLVAVAAGVLSAILLLRRANDASAGRHGPAA